MFPNCASGMVCLGSRSRCFGGFLGGSNKFGCGFTLGLVLGVFEVGERKVLGQGRRVEGIQMAEF
jgi:hypothetical protein